MENNIIDNNINNHNTHIYAQTLTCTHARVHTTATTLSRRKQREKRRYAFS